MNDTTEALLHELRDYEYAEGYAEELLNARIATQIKVLREQQEITQEKLAPLMGTTQTAVSRIENVNYSSWSIKTLKKIARALRVRLHVSFESFGTLPDEVGQLTRERLQRPRHDKDPLIWGSGLESSGDTQHHFTMDGVPQAVSVQDSIIPSRLERDGTPQPTRKMPVTTHGAAQRDQKYA